jgi:hypothetical protein
MDIEYQTPLQKEKDHLSIIPSDLNQFDDPLDNILLDVMFDSFYNRIQHQKHSKSEE